MRAFAAPGSVDLTVGAGQPVGEAQRLGQESWQDKSFIAKPTGSMGSRRALSEKVYAQVEAESIAAVCPMWVQPV